MNPAVLECQEPNEFRLFSSLQFSRWLYHPQRQPLADRASPKVRLKAPGGFFAGIKASFPGRISSSQRLLHAKVGGAAIPLPGQCGWSVLEQTDSHVAIHPVSISSRLLTSTRQAYKGGDRTKEKN